VLSHLYQNPDDLAAIREAKQIFRRQVIQQYGHDFPFMSGGEPWPVIVAHAIITDRSEDGAGDPDGVFRALLSLVSGHGTAQHVR
jgi:hypothetical protein